MADDTFDFLGTVKTLLGIDVNSYDSILQLYIDLTKQSILNYCNISKLPSALNYTVCQICADLYREDTSKNSKGGVVGNVSSITEDGRTVAFGGIAEIKASVSDKISHTTELNRFKKLYRIPAVEEE